MFAIRRRERLNPAQRRYVGRVLPLVLGYVLILMTCTWVIRVYAPTGGALFLLALLPSLPLLGWIGVLGLYLRDERDEFIRSRLVAAMIGGLGLMLAVTTVWGFLENGGAVPHFPTFLCFPLWAASFGLWQCIRGFGEAVAARRA
jgi:hypothetical protein